MGGGEDKTKPFATQGDDCRYSNVKQDFFAAEIFPITTLEDRIIPIMTCLFPRMPIRKNH